MRQVMSAVEEYLEDREDHGPSDGPEDAWQRISHAYYEARDRLSSSDETNDRALVRHLAAQALGYLCEVQEGDENAE